MKRLSRPRALAASALAWAGTAAAQPAGDGPAAIELVPPGWTVLDCSVSRGVLYLRYRDRERQRIAVTPAFPNPAVLGACAAAGRPLAASAPQRLAMPSAPTRVGLAPLPGTAAAAGGAPRAPGEPSFQTQISGSRLTINGRNDGDVPLHCLIDLAWTSGQIGSTPQVVSQQVQLPARQAQQVLSVTSPQGGMQLVGPPRWSCRPG